MTTVLFIVTASVGLTGGLYACTHNAWVGVLAMGVCVSVYIMENWGLHREVIRLEERDDGKDRDLCTLKEALLHLIECNSKLEHQAEGCHCRLSERRSKSAGSLGSAGGYMMCQWARRPSCP